jgi:DNA-binding Lrp family transcriptional regulator
LRALDETDRAIVDLLRVDGRATLSTLGESLGVSRTTVQQRILRLRNEGSVRVVGLVDPMVRGRAYSLLLDIAVSGNANAVADAVAALPEAHLSVTTESPELVLAQVALESGFAVRDFFNDKMRSIEGVVDIRSDLILSIYSSSSSARGDGASQWADSNSSGVQLDVVDATIVGELQSDGRASFASLARACGLSTPAARQRTLRLIADDVVRIRTLVAPEILELHAPAAFSVHLAGNSRVIVEAIAEIPGVTNVSEVVGANDIRGEVYCHDDQDLKRCIGAIESIRGVTHVLVHRYRYLANPGGAWSD